jgi:hypothetical protein
VIRKGAAKDPVKKGPGKDLTYFRVEFDAEEEETARKFEQVYGTEPKRINMLLPFATPDENWKAWREAYVASGLVHRCDGRKVWFEVDYKTAEKTVVNGVPEKACDGKTPIATWKSRQTGEEHTLSCKPVGRLKVMLRDAPLVRLAYLTFVTTSIWDVIHIDEQLRGIELANRSLVGIPLILQRRAVSVSTRDDTGKRSRRIKSLVSVEPDPAWVRARFTAWQQDATPEIEVTEPIMGLLEEPDEPDEPTDPPASDEPTWPMDIVRATVGCGAAENAYEAVGILTASPWACRGGGPAAPLPAWDIIEPWLKQYRGALDEQKNPDPVAAAAKADKVCGVKRGIES